MIAPTYNDLLETVRSDKSTQRHEGIKSLREYLEQERIVNKLDEHGDGKVWVALFQALFCAVKKEKAACIKKGLDRATDAAIKKLGDVSDALRWFTERVCPRVQNTGVDALIQHCLEILVHLGEMFTPVAFPTLQILRVLFAFPAHRDHLKRGRWIKILAVSFSILNNDEIRPDLTVDEKEEAEVKGMAFEDKMDVDNSTELVDNDNDAPATPSRGRSRPIPVRRSQVQKLLQTRPRHVALSREQICVAEVIHLLLASPYAVFIKKDDPYVTRAILNKFRRFLEMFPLLTTVHHHIIHGIILTLTHAEMNSHAEVVDFGHKTWGALLSLWQNKDIVVKEGLVMIFTILLPFVTQTHLTRAPLDPTNIEKLQKLLLAETELSVQTKGLTLADLRLEINEAKTCDRPFLMRTFQSSSTFSAKQAHYWAVLELQAACLAKVIGASLLLNPN